MEITTFCQIYVSVFTKYLGACHPLLAITSLALNTFGSGCEVHMVDPDFRAASDYVNHEAFKPPGWHSGLRTNFTH